MRERRSHPTKALILTIKFIREVVTTGRFANLEEFCVEEYEAGVLTLEGVEFFIENCEHLKRIEGLETCPPLDIQELKREILVRNLDP